jgi:hypothetical protein
MPGYDARVKVSVRFPDELYRQFKAQCALEGRTVRSVTIELISRWLDEPPDPPDRERSGPVSKSMQDFAGIADSGIPDLATNPKHLEDLGRDSMGRR